MMTIRTKLLLYTSMLFAGMGIYSCGNSGSKAPGNNPKDSIKIPVKKEKKQEPAASYQRPPIVNIVDTVVPKRIVIYCTDSAATFERIGLKLARIYSSKLPEYIRKNNLKTAGAPMAWYKKQKAPYFFEAGVPVNKKGTRSVAGVHIREMGAGKAVLAHFYGPFELLPVGYDVLKEWMKDNKRTAAGAPYEMYMTDPVDKKGKPVDPYKIQTDIIFPIK